MSDDFQVLGDVLRSKARFGERVAFRDTVRSVSFAGFETRVRELVHALERRGLRRGDRLVLLSRNSVASVECFAAASAGFVVVPLNWRLSLAELNLLVRDCAPRAIFCDEFHLSIADDGVLAGVEVPVRICLDGPGRPGWLQYETLIEENASAESKDGPPEPDDPALIIYTSGTTGAPKGVVISHRALLFNAGASAKFVLAVGEDDRSLCIMPLFHVGGLCFYLLANYMAGASSVLRPAFDLNELVATLRDEEITNVHLVPSMISDLVGHPDTRAAAKMLKRLMYAGSPMPLALLERAMTVLSSCGFAQAYGSTEGGCISALGPAEHRAATSTAEQRRLLQSCGRPVPGCAVQVLRDDGSTCEIGELGEVTVDSRGTMLGYWGLPERSASAFVDGRLRTGDIGHLDADGYLYLVDRKNDMIVTGGENVFPSEVEQVLYRCPGVAEAAVFSVPDPRWIEKVVAAVVLARGSSVTAAEIIGFARQQLAGYKCPKKVLIVQRLPLTGVGKVSRKHLRQEFSALLEFGRDQAS